jgi:hypothetical protein
MPLCRVRYTRYGQTPTGEGERAGWPGAVKAADYRRQRRGIPQDMEGKEDAPLEVVVLRGTNGYMATVLMNGEWVGFFPAETRTAATAQAVLAITDSLPS